MNTLHLISHTHWDREWYRAFQQFRLKLIHLVDGLLDVLEKDKGFKHFMLDGQTIVLDDYLQMRPENEARLRHFVNTGRLTIGPWHILPDEFLVSPEATIRNLLEGDRTCRRFGPRMAIGYIPDPFGHIGQMPQILKGFGINAACVQRGLADEPCEFLWQAPDGSRVFMSYLRDGYGNAAGLPTSEPEHFIEEVKRLRDNLIPYSAGKHLLLMLGTDHMEPPLDTTSAIKAARGKVNGDVLVHSSLVDYVTAIQASVDPRTLPVVVGELRECKRSHLLPGVLSTRMWIKQRNRACETLLEKWAEPFSTFATHAVHQRPAGMLSSPDSILHQTWRLLMENHPHDSICGCSIDQVHDEMKVRFDQVDQIGEEITLQSLESLAQSVNTPDLPAIIVFNPIGTQRTDVVETTVESTTPFDLLDGQGREVPYQTLGIGSQELINIKLKPRELRSLYVAVRDGRVMGLSIVGIKIKRQDRQVILEVVLTEHGEPNLQAWKDGVAEIESLFTDPEIESFHVHAQSADKTQLIFSAGAPGLGWQTYRLQPRPVEARSAVQILRNLISRPESKHPSNQIEDDNFSVKVKRNGTLSILDKSSGMVYDGLNRFQDGGDCGDEYNYCPPSSDRVTTARLKGASISRGSIQQSMLLDLDIKIPAALSKDRNSRSKAMITTRITSRISLTAGVPRVDIHTELENRASDHRLRVHFPAPFAAVSALYDGHFELVERRIGLPEFDDTWVEQPRPEVPQRAFAAVTNGTLGLIIANRGLPEVESLNNARGNAEIAVTLLRCVGWLSREFANRKGHAGPAMETPGAQMFGKWVFDYAIIPAAGNVLSSCRHAYAFEAPLRSVSTGAHPGDLPSNGSFVAGTPDEFIISTIKQAQDGKGWLVRGYNIGGDEISVNLRPWRAFRHAEHVNLAEERVTDLKPGRDGAVNLKLRGHEIATVRLWD